MEASHGKYSWHRLHQTRKHRGSTLRPSEAGGPWPRTMRSRRNPDDYVRAICGNDQHMVLGCTTVPVGISCDYEVDREVTEAARDAQCIKVGDPVSVPCNVTCGGRRNYREQATGVCLSVNPGRASGVSGHLDIGIGSLVRAARVIGSPGIRRL